MSDDLTTLDIGFGPGKWGNWNWGTVQSVGVQNGSDRTFVSVQAAFAFLLLFGMLVLSIWILVLNRSRKVALKPMPIITTLVAMIFMVAAMTNLFAYTTVRLSVEKAKQYYYICSMLTALFEPACYGTMFYVFYAILHLFWVPITNPSARIFSIVKNVHWAIVGIFAALVIVDWSWAILFLNSAVHAEFIYIQQNAVWEKIDSARSILFWISSWEVLAWALYLGLMTSRKASIVKIKMSVFFFIAAAGFFLAINFLFFAWDMIWYLGQGETSSLDESTSEGTETVQRVLRFVFVQGAFFGLVLCYWRYPEPEPSFEEPSVDHGFIDRTGVIPREVEGSTPDTGIYEKKNGISEADDSKGILEADDSTPISDKKVGIFEAEGSKGILEADSNIVHETV